MEDEHPELRYETGAAKKKSEFYSEGIDKPIEPIWQSDDRFTDVKKKHNKRINQICNHVEIINGTKFICK